MTRRAAPGLAILLVTLFAVSPVRAQNDGSGVAETSAQSDDDMVFGPARDVYDEGAFAYVLGGYNWLDMGAINRVLRRNGYGDISPHFLHIGTGAFFTVRRWLFGFETYLLLGNSGEVGDNQASFDGTYWIGHIAYLLSLGPLHIYPILGAGWGNYTLELLEGRPDIDDVLQRNTNELTIELSAPLLQAAVNIEYLLATSRTEESVRGFLIGLRLGYFVAPFGTSWALAGYGLDDPTDTVLTSLHLSLVAGFGSWSASDMQILP